MDKGRTDSTESTDKLALKREEGGRYAQNLKKIKFENLRDLKVLENEGVPLARQKSSKSYQNRAKLLKLKKNNKNSSTAVCSLWPHCYLARLCLRTRSRTKTVLSMGSLNEPQKASEVKTGKNNFFLEPNINDCFLMNINFRIIGTLIFH